MPTKSLTFLPPSKKPCWGFCRKVIMRKVDLREILKPIWDFLKKFKKPQKKTSTTIFIPEIHVDKIEVSVYPNK